MHAIAWVFVLIPAAWLGVIVLDMLSRARPSEKEKFILSLGIAILGLLAIVNISPHESST